MTAFRYRRRLAVVSAVMTAKGTPDFALHEVDVTPDEYENGVHYDRVEELLFAAGYEEPFTHFDECEAPAFLHAAVRQYLAMKPCPQLKLLRPPEKKPCPASLR